MYWCGQQTRRRSTCGLHLRRSSASWLNAKVYYTLVDCKLMTPLLRFVLDLSYKLFLHCYAAVGKILTDTSRRASAVAELLDSFYLTHDTAASATANSVIVHVTGDIVRSLSFTSRTSTRHIHKGLLSSAYGACCPRHWGSAAPRRGVQSNLSNVSGVYGFKVHI